jgi:hypothetical protein
LHQYIFDGIVKVFRFPVLKNFLKLLFYCIHDSSILIKLAKITFYQI